MAKAYIPHIHGMVFKPAADITAYELAVTLQKVSSLSMVIPPKQIIKWPYGLCRHWRLVQSSTGTAQEDDKVNLRTDEPVQ